MEWIFSILRWIQLAALPASTLFAKAEMDCSPLWQVFFAVLLMALGVSQSQMAFPDVSKAKAAIQNVFGCGSCRAGHACQGCRRMVSKQSMSMKQPRALKSFVTSS